MDLPVLLRALCFGAGVAAALAALVWVCGAVPSDLAMCYVLGFGASVFAAVLALWVHSKFLDPSKAAPFAGDSRLMSGRLQSLLAAAFGAKLAVVVLGMFALRQSGVKFEGLATFCVTFAAVSLVCQLATAGYLSRILQWRASSRTPDVSDRTSLDGESVRGDAPHL